MFLRTLKVQRNHQVYEYLKVVENTRDQGKTQQHTLVNFGNVSQWPAEKLQKLIALLAAFIDMPLGTVSSSPLDDIEISARRILGPFLPLAQLWDQLGLQQILTTALSASHSDPRLVQCIKALVFTQIISPRSKLSTHDYVGAQTEIPGIDGEVLPLHCYYQALDALSAAHVPIEQALHQHLQDLFNRDLSLVFYDLTSSYFEGKHCQKAHYGYSRDHRPDCVQIEIGLLVDNNGVPIGHDVFEGNIKDMATVLNALERLQKDFAVKRCVFVGDDGMTSDANLAQLTAHGYEYITSLSLGKSLLGQQLLEEAPYRATWLTLKEISCQIYQFPEVAETPGTTYVGTYNAARAASTRDKRGRRLRACLTLLQELQQKSQRRATAKTGNACLLRADRFLRQKSCAKFFTLSLTDDQWLSYALKREAIRQARRTEGILILKSDSTTLNAEEIVRGYRSLWMVEDAFRHLKDPLHLRPIRHWSDPRVLGHVFICVLAFTLERLYTLALEKHQIPLTARKAFEQLADIETVLLETHGKALRKRSKISIEQQKLLSAVGIKEVPLIW
jgi:transposase